MPKVKLPAQSPTGNLVADLPSAVVPDPSQLWAHFLFLHFPCPVDFFLFAAKMTDSRLNESFLLSCFFISLDLFFVSFPTF